MKNKYYSLVKEGNNASLNIYGDITSWPWLESDVSAYNLSKQLNELEDDITHIDVFINSYGGEVAEGLAIYNALKRHKASVTTYCDGFACSIASVIFMAGDERIMNAASLLMIHNAWTVAQGNANELRKQAEDLEKITSASVEAYKLVANISEEEIKELMDNETWITPSEAVQYGFATVQEISESDKPSQSARQKIYDIFMKAVKGNEEENDLQDEPDTVPEEKEIVEKIIEEESEQEKTNNDNQSNEKIIAFFNALK